MRCLNCKMQFVEGELVIEEWINGLLLPPSHRECMEPMEYRNALRRKGTILYFFKEEVVEEKTDDST